MIENNVGELIKATGSTVSEIAPKIGIHENVLYRMINGESQGITFKNLYKLCKYFKCTPDKILRIKKEAK